MAEAPLSAEEIAHRGFPSTFRGFDPVEVRAYLVRVSSELKAAAAREREMKQKLIDAEHRAANPVIDQAMLTRSLGEETARVLVSAQEAARQLQAKAEDGVARILREAHEQAQRIRAEAEVVLADRTEEADAVAAEIRAGAQAEAAAVVEQARREAEAARGEVAEQARQLVQEAQAARARVLGDLARRRRIAHTQVEQLRAGRARLLEAYRVVRRTLDEVADELERVEVEARSAAGAAGRRAEAALEAGDAGVLGEEVEAVGNEGPAGGDAVDEVAGAIPAVAAADPVPPEAVTPPEPTAPAPTHAPARAASSSVAPPVVAREERVEERKLSSLRILRRPKAGTLPGPELEVREGVSEVEGVRVIPASAEPRSGAAAPTPVRGDREEPSVVPGVSWAPAPAVPSPPALGGSGAPPVPPAPTASQAPPVAPPPTTANAATVAPAPTAPPPQPARGASPATTEASPSVSAPGPVAPSPAAPVEDEGDPAAPAAKDPSTPASPAEAIFARIRADRAGGGVSAVKEEQGTPAVQPPPETVSDPAQAAPAAPASEAMPAAPPDEEELLLQRRDEAIEAIESALARKLKRAMQDEHNDVLDRLRSCKGTPSIPAFLPSPADQAARYAAAAGDLLMEAARSGVRFVTAGEAEPSPLEVADVVADLTESLVGPLRRGVEGSLESGQEDASVLADTIGAAYRECKTQRLERLAADATIAAFSRGTLIAAGGADLRWVVDDGDAACPDCDDNALAGPTPSGQHYPTGQSHPPAHAGCRCLLVPRRP